MIQINDKVRFHVPVKLCYPTRIINTGIVENIHSGQVYIRCNDGKRDFPVERREDQIIEVICD